MSAIAGFASIGQGILQALGQATASSSTNTASGGNSTVSIHGHHRHGHGGGKGLRSQIESAVENALSSASPGSNPDQTIQTAIEQILKGAASATAAGNPATSNTDAAGTPEPGSAQQTFSQFLQAHGVDQQQFISDLQAAFQSAQGNGTSSILSSVFSQLPLGSEIDVNA